MKFFDLPFAIAKEVVKRKKNDNRRHIEQRERGGNNFFYLGSTNELLDKFSEVDSLKVDLLRVKALLENPTRSPKAIQNNEGIPVMHKIPKESLLELLPFLKAFLLEYGSSYHNPNLDSDRVFKELNKIKGKYLSFNSDLVFIHDNKSIKPYFKWFTQKDSSESWELIQEFFIPKLSFLNFKFESYQNGIMQVVWELTYAPTVIYSSSNLEEIISSAVAPLINDVEERETLKEAITKIRLGQSQFRKDLLDSENNTCIFTNIDDPKLLIASHIKPWSKSDDRERRDCNNGLLLTPIFDKLFDKFLITFDEQGRLVWTDNRLSTNVISKIKKMILNENEPYISVTHDNAEYLSYHRRTFYELERRMEIK